MLGVRLAKLGIAGGVGLLHVGCLYADETQGWEEPFRRAQDYPQTIGFVLGLGSGLMLTGDVAEYGEALAVASEPLLIRSIYEAVRGSLGSPKRKTPRSRSRWKLVKRGIPEQPEGPARIRWG